MVVGPNPEISIVIPTLRGGDPLRECLRSLEEQDSISPELLLVANGPDAVVDERLGLRSVSEVIRNPTNLGFAAAVNQGIRRSRAPWVLVLNDDVVVPPDFLREVVAATGHGFDAIATRVVLKGTREIDSAGIVALPDGSAEERLRGEDASSERANRAAEIFGASGAAAVYSRRLLEATGAFDEGYFAYFEDVDLAWRARFAGFRCLYWPRASLEHLHSASWGRVSERKLFLLERNRLWTLWKDYPLPRCILSPVHRGASLVRLSHSAYVSETTRKELGGMGTSRLARIELAAYLSAARRFRALWRDRRKTDSALRRRVVQEWLETRDRPVALT